MDTYTISIRRFYVYMYHASLARMKTPPQEVIINQFIWPLTSPLEHGMPPAIHKPSKTAYVIARSMANNVRNTGWTTMA